jgi:hypothetical protein
VGEIYMWSVHYAKPGEGAPIVDGKPGWQSDGSYLWQRGLRLAQTLADLLAGEVDVELFREDGGDL